MTGLGRYLALSILSMLLIGPAVAQTPSPPSSSRTPATTPPATTPPATTPPATKSQSPATAGSQQQGGLVDINSASAEELDKLPGVGPARAKAIIANRPYNGKDDLIQRKILPANVYNQIKDKIIARQGTAKK
jgi:competence protein ComEA